MKTRRIFVKSISLQLVLVIFVSIIINFIVQTNEVKAATYTQISKTGISEFPESYQKLLKELSELHPDWTFTAFYTGISWDEFMQNESSLGGNGYSHGKNTVIASAESSWLDNCNVVKSGYACASPEIIAYFADPRNFLTESGVFQFLEMSYNSSVHTTAGVKSIIKGTFMENDIETKVAEEEVSVKAKIKDKYILVAPETKVSEIAKELKIDNYAVTDDKNNTIQNPTSNDKNNQTENTITTGNNIAQDNTIGGNNVIAENVVINTTENTINSGKENVIASNNMTENTIKGNTTNTIENVVSTEINNTIEKESIANTGYIFIDKKYNKTYTIVVLGDVNGDGKVKATDYAKIKNFIMDGAKLNEIQKLAADVNGDGEVKATDYAKIKNYIMNSTLITVKDTKKNVDTKISYAEIIMKAAEESGISPYSIAIKIIQEVGRKGSGSVSGTYPGYEGYYNFFNIGAYDSGNAIANGLQYAKDRGWNTQEIAIVEGAKYMSDSYINVGQNTAYFYKFDVIDGKNGTFWHQYMTNIQDPSSQAKNLYNTYTKNNMLDISLNFIIPVYDNMPNVCAMPGTISPNDTSSYYINGTAVNLRAGVGVATEQVAILSKNEIVTVLELNVGEADGYTWAKIKRANGATGFVANKYLIKT